MGRGSKRVLTSVVSVVFTLSILAQSFIPVNALVSLEKGKTSWQIYSGEVLESPWCDSAEIPVENANDIFSVECIMGPNSVTTGVYKERVEYSLNDKTVSFAVYGGSPGEIVSRIGRSIDQVGVFPEKIVFESLQYDKYGDVVDGKQCYRYKDDEGKETKIIKTKQEVGVFPETIERDYKGKIVTYTKRGEPSSENIQTYEYIIENTFTYDHNIVLSYVYNERPEIVEFAKPSSNLVGEINWFNNTIPVSGKVSDGNIGDKLKIKYSIDYDKDIGKVSGTELIGNIDITDKNSKEFNSSINLNNLHIKEGRHTLYVWAEDSKNKTSPTTNMTTMEFYYKNNRPEAPVIKQNPANDKPTNGDVTVTMEVYEPNKSVTDGVYDPFKGIDTIKDIQYKVGPDGEWMKYDPKNPFKISVNEVVYGKVTDKAGNVGDEGIIYVNNIDKEKPSVTINTYGSTKDIIEITAQDKESGIDRIEYATTASESEVPKDDAYKKYENMLNINKEGITVVWARAYDKAGNMGENKKTFGSVKVASTSTPIPTNNGGGNGNNGGNGGNGNNGGNGSNGGNGGGTVINNSSPTSVPSSGGVIENPRSVPVSGPYDLAVYLTAEKRAYGENEIITFTINYKNKLSSVAEDVVLKAQIPAFTTIDNAAGGKVNGSTIEWTIGEVDANASDKKVYSVKVGLLEKSEADVSNVASISSTAGTNNDNSDDQSSFGIRLFSNRFGDTKHNKYIIGYKDNTFLPENSITRAEVATILMRVLNLSESAPDGIEYKDVKDSHWANGAIYAVTKKNLFEGYKDGTFKPDAYITRAELSTALARYMKANNVAPFQIHFKDINKHWAKNFIEEIYRLKLIEGYKDGTFLPDAKIKRAETVTIINRMLYRGPLGGAEVKFKDVKKGYWAYGQIAECSLDHYYTRNNDSISSESMVNK